MSLERRVWRSPDGVLTRWSVHGADGALALTAQHPPAETAAVLESIGALIGGWQPLDLSVHRPTGDPDGTDCDVIGGRCHTDGTALGAQRMWEQVVIGGQLQEALIWHRLEDAWWDVVAADDDVGDDEDG
jgi:hypothetical protein